MFKILKNPEATSTELADVYVGAERLEETLAGEKSKVYEALMAAQIECFDNEKPTREFLSAQKRLETINTKIEGCRFGRRQIKNRLGERLQVESQERLEVIGKELDAVTAEEKTLKGQYLDACALAALTQEQIRGAETSYNGSVLVRLTPDPKFNFQLLSGEEQVYYSTKVEEIRQESGTQDFSGTIAGRRSSLVEEQGRIERLLESDPLANAEELLSRLIPSKPEPTPEPEVRKTQTFFKDYSNLAPDYEEGQELPFKGVGEVLHDRQEMK
jgi:hypothetical protein